MKVIKRNRSEVEFDCSKICAALEKAIELFAGIDSIEQGIMVEAEELTETTGFTLMHTFAHWLMHIFGVMWDRFLNITCYNPLLDQPRIINLHRCSASIKLRQLVEVRMDNANINLPRIHDRGSGDTDSHDNNRISGQAGQNRVLSWRVEYEL